MSKKYNKSQSRSSIHILSLLLEHNNKSILNPDTLLSSLHPKQLSLITNPAKNKVAVTSRRAGKTFAAIRYMLWVALSNPNALIAYLTKTRDWAESLVWQPLKNLDKEYNLGIKFNTVKLKAVFPNGSVIRLAGAKDKSQAEVLRGFAYHLFIIDEAGSITPDIMEYVLKEVLASAMEDYDGTLLVVGTPNPSCTGFFHDISTDPDSGFTSYHWTVRDNPYFPRWAAIKDYLPEVDLFLAAARARWGFKEDDPEYLREYLGLWVRSDDDFIFSALGSLTPVYESESSLPPDLKYILGIDLGYHDEAAFNVLGFSQSEQSVYEVESYSASHMDLTSIINKAKTLATQYATEIITIDPASGGIHLVSELTSRYNLPAIASDKKNKATWFKLLNADIRTGRTYYKSKDSTLLAQSKTLLWDKSYKREAEGQPCDQVDAFLYAYRYAYHYIHESIPKELTIDEYMFEQTLKSIQDKAIADAELFGYDIDGAYLEALDDYDIGGY